jgi:hypothetical protein
VLPLSFVATVADQVIVPVVGARLFGMVPIRSDGSGGQSWLVGYPNAVPL